MKDTLNKQKGMSKKNVAVTGVGFTKAAFHELDEKNMKLQSELVDSREFNKKLQTEFQELGKQKKIADDTNSTLTMEVQALRKIIVNQSRVIFK